MSTEVGNKFKGRVTDIKKFGVFVELSEGKSGLVHINEVADNYVESVEEHLSAGDRVGVKVLSIADDGKTSLSVKKAKDCPRGQYVDKLSHQKPVQKVEDFEKKLSDSLKDSGGKLASIKRQTESRHGDKDSKR